MTKNEYSEIENYMLDQMKDSAHDRHHVYRVLNSALDIAGHIGKVDKAKGIACERMYFLA